MWRISCKTISLPDIVIMAHMNVVQAKLPEGLCSAEFTVASIKWREPVRQRAENNGRDAPSSVPFKKLCIARLCNPEGFAPTTVRGGQRPQGARQRASPEASLRVDPSATQRLCRPITAPV